MATGDSLEQDDAKRMAYMATLLDELVCCREDFRRAGWTREARATYIGAIGNVIDWWLRFKETGKQEIAPAPKGDPQKEIDPLARIEQEIGLVIKLKQMMDRGVKTERGDHA